MSQSCAIKTCKRASRTLCHCCNENLCRDHFNEHDDLLNSQLNPLSDKVNALSDRLTAINIDKINNEHRQQVNQWRIDCHEAIDLFYEQKCQELDQYVTKKLDEQRREIADLRLTMTELIDRQETTKNDINSLTLAIHTLEQKMNEIEQIHIQIDLHSLEIDNNLIQIKKPKLNHFDLLNLPPVYGTINRTRTSYNSLVGNDRFLLTCIDSNLCLIDKNLSVVKQKKWNYGDIEDMCWSEVLERFFVILKQNIMLLDENTMSIKQVQQLTDANWNSCECSDESLYLSRCNWDSSVLEFSLLPSIQFVKLWKTTDKLEQKQRIDAIVYNRGTLALAINDQSNEAKLIELRSSKTFNIFWAIQLDVSYNTGVVRCCRLSHDDWLLVDWPASHLFHITNGGELKGTNEYKPMPFNMNVFGSNILAILTDTTINFHKL
ncbi:unnamed protein product [Rotaria sp. Silwood1]|nr:unnamed protein product [Rotaria sp. Silwood1]CAF1648450.1 unnamed protein product [Rotaria sp. Silwood1]CAF3804693.1 unnamed protein product [Rotaria sp. Silwood1]CAF3868480.1 unnamed protein product [Rotaria sp. Silwood1]CAF3950994.1 unnamed protein product [Rotaria sp. Silwood1]